MSPSATCAVCGRTILDGERIHAYVSVEGSHQVCSLCAPRAEAAGWLPADQVDAPALPVPPKRSLLDRVFGRRRDTGEGPGDPAEADEPVATAAEPESESDLADPVPAAEAPETEAVEVPLAAEPEPEPVEEPPPAPRPDPAGPGMRSRSRPVDDEEGELAPISRFERAILRFNVSEAGRTVAGLTRTLGPPSVSIGASASGPQDVRITVAWELSWYQWGVDLGDELRPVFQLAKGYELVELDHSARRWNATAVDGRIVIGEPERTARRGDAVRR